MNEKLRKFNLLMWKNWIIQTRKPCETLTSILFPLLFACFVVLIRRQTPQEHKSAITYPIYNPLDDFDDSYLKK